MSAAVADEYGPARRKLEILVDRTLAFYDEQAELLRIVTSLADPGGRDLIDSLGFDVAEVERRWRANVRRVVAEARSEGALAPADPDALVTLYLAFLGGLLATPGGASRALPREALRDGALRLLGHRPAGRRRTGAPRRSGRPGRLTVRRRRPRFRGAPVISRRPRARRDARRRDGDGLRAGTGPGRRVPNGCRREPAGNADPTPRPSPGHEVYGYLPYWEMDDGIAAHLRATDLTTLALFSVTNTRTGAIDTKQNGYRRITGPVGAQLIREAHERSVRPSSSSSPASARSGTAPSSVMSRGRTRRSRRSWRSSASWGSTA
jgi:hypothetical protein